MAELGLEWGTVPGKIDEAPSERPDGTGDGYKGPGGRVYIARNEIRNNFFQVCAHLGINIGINT